MEVKQASHLHLDKSLSALGACIFSCKNTNLLTFSNRRAACLELTMLPTVLKSLVIELSITSYNLLLLENKKPVN